MILANQVRRVSNNDMKSVPQFQRQFLRLIVVVEREIATVLLKTLVELQKLNSRSGIDILNKLKTKFTKSESEIETIAKAP